MRPLDELTADLPVLVVGDVMLDRHILGRVERISPEAPVPVVAVERETCALGGAGHVAASLAALGCRVTLAGVVGDDADGLAAIRVARELRIQSRLRQTAASETICKTRVLGLPQQQLLRLDRDGRRDGLDLIQAGGVELVSAVPRFAAVVIADYDKGTVPDELAGRLVAACRRADVTCIVDSKRASFAVYRGATWMAPNAAELERAYGEQFDCAEALAEAAARLRTQLGLQALVVTRGAAGMTVAAPDGLTHVPATARTLADVTGAGDTVTAVLAVCAAHGWPVDKAAQLAALAAGLAVARPGTYAVPLAELQAAYGGVSPKRMDWDRAWRAIADAQRRGQVVVFTNGCFDLLHAGHLSCLERARGLGHMLVVGLNSDASVRANKGPGRPVIAEAQRAELLAGLACVDAVVLFNEPRPELLVRHLAPDVLVKGDDYAVEEIAGAEFVLARGGRVVTLPLLEGLSTSALCRTLQAVGSGA